jgi:hypothetical protein
MMTMMKTKQPVIFVDADMVSTKLCVSAQEDAWVKMYVEAHEGLANVFAERAGELTLAAPRNRQVEFASMIEDLETWIRSMRERLGKKRP